MSYTRKFTPIEYQYSIENTTLARTQVIKDLSVLFDIKLIFKQHIRETYSSAIRMLGFVIRNTHDFDNQQVIFTLFYALVRSKLEYSNII